MRIVFALFVVALVTPFVRAQEGDAYAVRVGLLDLAHHDPPECFSDLFLHLVRYETDIDAARAVDTIAPTPEALATHPFVFLAGEGAFELTDDEVAALRTFVAHGGTLVFSPSCSNPDFGTSCERAIARIAPGQALVEIPDDHDIFSSLYDIADLVSTDGTAGQLFAVEVSGRMRILYSPQGLADTDGAGGGCCCCGTHELRQGRFLSANLLVYALTN
jgi:hypothetical protein